MKKLTVVGMGPGEYESMTLRAVKALNTCDVIVGYTVYVDLAKPYFPDKEFLTTPMKREIERCESVTISVWGSVASTELMTASCDLRADWESSARTRLIE